MKSAKILVLLCVAVFASAGLSATSPLNNPRGLAVDAKGNLYVANTLGGPTGTGNILVYSPTYVLQSTMTITQDMNLPIGVAFDGLGNLWVAVAGANRYSTTGSLLEFTGGVEDNTAIYTDVANPAAIAIDGIGNIWVNNNDGSISIFTPLIPLSSIYALSQTITPTPPVYGLAASANAILWGGSPAYIADSYEASRGNIAFGSSLPANIDGVAMGSAAGGATYIGNSDQSVYLFAPQSLGPFLYLSFVPAGIAVDNVRGRVYISSGFGNSIAVYSTAGKLLHTIK
jgi:hypothetical protein